MAYYKTAVLNNYPGVTAVLGAKPKITAGSDTNNVLWDKIK